MTETVLAREPRPRTGTDPLRPPAVHRLSPVLPPLPPGETPATALAGELAPRGYMEEERILHARARVHDDSEGDLRVAAPEVPAATRVVVRRPVEPRRFSGTVVVELLEAADGIDVAHLWSALGEWVTDAGHAWVGMTAGPMAADALRRLHPERYADLSWASVPGGAVATARCGDQGFQPQGLLDGAEEGLVWDLLAALCLELRDPGVAPAGAAADLVLVGGHGLGGIQVNTFANTLHEPYSRHLGAQIVDGYLNVGGGGLRRTLRQEAGVCGVATWRPARPPRLEVPHVTVSSEADHVLIGSARLAPRSDLGPLVRHVQLAGAPHRDLSDPWRPAPALLARAGRPVVVPGPDASIVPLGPLVEGMAVALEEWARGGRPAPASRWLALDAEGALVRGELDVPLGGVRTGLTDMPIVSTIAATPRALEGVSRPMCARMFAETYEDRASFLAWFDVIERACLEDRYLTERGVAFHRRLVEGVLDRMGVA